MFKGEMFMKTDAEWFLDYMEEAARYHYSRQIILMDISRKLEEIYSEYRDQIQELLEEEEDY